MKTISYTAMVALAFVALLVGCDGSSSGFVGPPPPPPPPPLVWDQTNWDESDWQ
jgi:hypothetical protein